MAFVGQLRMESAGPIYGWACEHCGLKAETQKKVPPDLWLGPDGRKPLFGYFYVTSDLFCTKRCHVFFNGLPWPPARSEIT